VKRGKISVPAVERKMKGKEKGGNKRKNRHEATSNELYTIQQGHEKWL
jgi:hypothetical protein